MHQMAGVVSNLNATLKFYMCTASVENFEDQFDQVKTVMISENVLLFALVQKGTMNIRKCPLLRMLH